MSDLDRLAQIRERRTRVPALFDSHIAADIDWLVGQVERLRDLLARLEWAGAEYAFAEDAWAICPACEQRRDAGHRHLAECWLDAELRPERKKAPPPA